jgi:hypothetical protein
MGRRIDVHDVGDEHNVVATRNGVGEEVAGYHLRPLDAGITGEVLTGERGSVWQVEQRSLQPGVMP